MKSLHSQFTVHNAQLFFVVARFIAGAVLLYAGFTKLTVPPEEFALALEGYRLFPVPVLMVLARVVPWAELFAGAFLLLGFELRFAAGLSALLFAGVLAALAPAPLSGIARADCGCFGRGGPHLSFLQALVFDGTLLALAVFIFFDKERRLSLDSRLRNPRAPQKNPVHRP